MGPFWSFIVHLNEDGFPTSYPGLLDKMTQKMPLTRFMDSFGTQL